MSNVHGASAVPGAATDISALILEGLRRTNDRVDEFQSALADMEIARANERREDTNRFADKIDRMGERLFSQMQANHAETQKKLAEVCDKGGKDHAKFEAEGRENREALAALAHRMELSEAREAGRKEARGAFLKFGAWVMENGRGIAAVAAAAGVGIGIGSLDFQPRDARAQAVVELPPVTNQQGTVAQSHAEDWPLRTFTDGVD